MFVFNILFLFLTIYFYGKKNHAMVLFSMLLIVTDGFGVLPAERGPLQKTDLLLLPILYICYVERKRDKNFFHINGDSIGKMIFLVLGFIIVEYLRTIFLSIDSPVWAFKVVRLQFMMLLYFYLRNLDITVWKKFFRMALIFSFFQGIFFYLQLVGLTGILAREIDTEADNIRYMNYPILSYFFIAYYLSYHGNTKKKLFMLFFWGMMILLGQSRGAILGVAGTLATLIFIQRNKKGLILLAAGVVVYMFVLSPLLATRDSGEKASTSDDISLLMSSSVDEIGSVKSTKVGSVAFRFGMLAERWVYLADNPELIPLGVGCIHEQSPANRFRFMLGTHNDKFTWGICMIESGDITWVPILLRYGLVGFILFWMLLIRWLLVSFKSCRQLNSTFSKASCLMPACIILISTAGTLFDAPNTMFLFCIYIGMLMSDEYFKRPMLKIS